MGTLYVDTETASPYREPTDWSDFRDTTFFEPTIFCVGYRPEGGDPKTELVTEAFFRDGPWGAKHDLRLYDELFEFAEKYGPVNRVVTYNGDNFDCIHLQNWAARIEDEEVGEGVTNEVAHLLDVHVDLMPTAVERCRKPLELEEWRDFVSLDDACDVAGVENPLIDHDSYDLDPHLLERAKQREDQPKSYLTNKQMVEFGEAYVESVAAGETDTVKFRALEQAMYDYAVSDVTPLAELDCNWVS